MIHHTPMALYFPAGHDDINLDIYYLCKYTYNLLEPVYVLFRVVRWADSGHRYDEKWSENRIEN